MTDTTDRENLELAAKAAGVEWFGYYGDDTVECQYLDIGTDDVVPWNPRHDNDDAFRLAARLKLQVAFGTFTDYEASAYEFGKPAVHVETCSNTDIEAAAREAIFLAAVEIGRGMK
jgi:hypothetical protein